MLQYTGASGVSGAGGHDGADHCGLVGVRLEVKAILLGSLKPPGVMGMLWPNGPPCCCHDIFAFEDLRTVASRKSAAPLVMTQRCLDSQSVDENICRGTFLSTRCNNDDSRDSRRTAVSPGE